MAQTRDQIQLMYGRLIDWQAANPLLLPGEVACVFDNDTMKPIDLKFGNGVARFSELPSMVNNDIVYTKDEVNILLKSITDRLGDLTSESTLAAGKIETLEKITIPGIQVLLDSEATSENRLAAISTVVREIEKRINGRFGRLVTFTPTGAMFTDLDSLEKGPWYVDGKEIEEIVATDTAKVDGYDYAFIFDGHSWEPDSAAVILTESQEAALNSGVTAEHVETVKEVKATTIDHEERLHTVEETSELNKKQIEDIANTADVVLTDRYSHTITITSGGSGYSVCSKCFISGSLGFISQTTAAGSIVSIEMIDSTVDLSTDVPVEIVSDGGTGAFCTIVSNKRVYTLDVVDTYHKKLMQVFSDYNLPKGLIDNKLKMVRNGQLLPIYTPQTTRYVDSAYTGASEGLEFAPYKKGTDALRSFNAQSDGTVVFAAGEYDEDLNVMGQSNKSFTGAAVGARASTIVRSIFVDKNSENIGFRDIAISSFMTIEGASQIYVDNLTFSGAVTIATKDVVHFSHCTFNGTVQVTTGTVEFDCCNFTNSAGLSILSDATAILHDCVRACVSVAERGTFVMLSGSCATTVKKSQAVSAETKSFVGLYDGVALKGDSRSFAPISITKGATYALGTFAFDMEASSLPADGGRIDNDGLGANQIYAGYRTGDNQGYAVDSPYLDEHLREISSRLFDISSKIVTGFIDEIEILTVTDKETGKTKLGVFVIQAIKDGKTVMSKEFTLPLGSAAHKDVDEFASAAEFKALNSSAYKVGGTNKIPYDALSDELKDKISQGGGSTIIPDEVEKVENKETGSTLTDSPVKYPSSQVVYREVYSPLRDLLARVPAVDGNLGDPENKLVTKAQLDNVKTGTGRYLTKKASGATQEAVIFDDILDLRAASVLYNGDQPVTSKELVTGDRAPYFAYTSLSGSGETFATKIELKEADFPDLRVEDLEEDVHYFRQSAIAIAAPNINDSSITWVHYANQTSVLGSAQLLALNSTITLDLVNKLKGLEGQKSILNLPNSVADAILEKQNKIPAYGTNYLVQATGTQGEVASRRIISDISATPDETIRDTGEKGYQSTDWFNSSTPNYAEPEHIPTASAVTKLVAYIAKETNDRLATKQPTLPTTGDWFHIEDNSGVKVIRSITDSQFKTLLTSDKVIGDYYLTPQKAANKYLDVSDAIDQDAFLTMPTQTAEGQPIKPTLTYKPTTTVTSSSKASDIPGAKAVYDAIKTADDTLRDELKVEIGKKQDMLEPVMEGGEISSHSYAVLTPPVKAGSPEKMKIVGPEEDILSEKIGDRELPTAGAIRLLVQKKSEAHKEDIDRVFTPKVQSMTSEQHRAMYEGMAPKYVVAEDGTLSLVSSGVALSSLATVKEYALTDGALPIALESYTTYVPETNTEQASRPTFIKIKAENTVFYGVTFLPAMETETTSRLGSYLELPITGSDTTDIFVSSSVAFKLINGITNLRFVNSTVYIYTPEGDASNYTLNLELVNSKAIVAVNTTNASAKVRLSAASDSRVIVRGKAPLLLTLDEMESTSITIFDDVELIAEGDPNQSVEVTYDVSATKKPNLDKLNDLPYHCRALSVEEDVTLFRSNDEVYRARRAKQIDTTSQIGGPKSADTEFALPYVTKDGDIVESLMSIGRDSAPYIKLVDGKLKKAVDVNLQTTDYVSEHTPISLVNGEFVPTESTLQSPAGIYALGAKKLANTSAIGAADKPVFFTADGVPSPLTKTTADYKLVKFSAGQIIEQSVSRGGSNTPVYLSSGILTAGNEYVPKTTGGTFGSSSCTTIGMSGLTSVTSGYTYIGCSFNSLSFSSQVTFIGCKFTGTVTVSNSAKFIGCTFSSSVSYGGSSESHIIEFNNCTITTYSISSTPLTILSNCTITNAPSGYWAHIVTGCTFKVSTSTSSASTFGIVKSITGCAITVQSNTVRTGLIIGHSASKPAIMSGNVILGSYTSWRPNADNGAVFGNYNGSVIF
ncbi:MAG: hypothetical protein NC218_02405 [Acetobacter sp.]|nr:hypothetical protein [Acetobacter sp.]